MNTGTLNFIVIILGLGWLAWRVSRALQVAFDAYRRGFKPLEIGGWTLLAVIDADRYWWGVRLDRLAVPEARELLAAITQARGLTSVVNLRCPLCDTEIKNALFLAADGELYVRRQTICAHCDFRVDACRHCGHFRPVADNTAIFDRGGDFSHGRCGFYRTVESVRTAYPLHARRLEALGYDMLPTPKLIVDSYIPLDECTAFSLRLELLRHNQVSWINRQRLALIQLHQRINRTR